ncbi:hypothetical protein DCO47_16865 [Pseudomonas sp. NDM]|nr:hypothetical protein DCO47_16865 [Pseudomonas sp. NDM]
MRRLGADLFTVDKDLADCVKTDRRESGPDFQPVHTPCGSEPARESGGSFNSMLPDPTYSRAGSLPHRWRCA